MIYFRFCSFTQIPLSFNPGHLAIFLSYKLIFPSWGVFIVKTFQTQSGSTTRKEQTRAFLIAIKSKPVAATALLQFQDVTIFSLPSPKKLNQAKHCSSTYNGVMSREDVFSLRWAVVANAIDTLKLPNISTCLALPTTFNIFRLRLSHSLANSSNSLSYNKVLRTSCNVLCISLLYQR